MILHLSDPTTNPRNKPKTNPKEALRNPNWPTGVVSNSVIMDLQGSFRYSSNMIRGTEGAGVHMIIICVMSTGLPGG